MFDSRLRPLIDPPLNAAGKRLARTGISANAVTVSGFVFGMAAAVLIALGAPLAGLVFVLLNRLADGLDGAVARVNGKTDLGGYLDITLDFFFYGAVPFAFAVFDPSKNALAAAALLLSFYANGASFLAFAIMAEKHGLETDRQGSKSLYYLGGLAEGAETIALFILMCLWPSGFVLLAWTFAAVCIVSAGARILIGVRTLRRMPTT
ncbi:CDP-alcohol phosphatidyltransferase family protein [Roseibium aggregatum]|uniref:CDP-alcohol phosphatidyltransferase family protein n=1 Tax=Roseibium aggregatum TaxID=187304 RepID=A0A926P4U1_9HYPH|nr:CDP-alcohol phosphatidyltransferase family protein [Roseibium aggregatum]MBD1547082.1 CDP-alcohol phosphatidyltransferase family protein [Roseibium aggregatum]